MLLQPLSFFSSGTGLLNQSSLLDLILIGCMCIHCTVLRVHLFVLFVLTALVEKKYFETVVRLLTFMFLLLSCHKELQVSLGT